MKRGSAISPAVLFLDAPFATIRRVYLAGHLTLREATALTNREVTLRRAEKLYPRSVEASVAAKAD